MHIFFKSLLFQLIIIVYPFRLPARLLSTLFARLLKTKQLDKRGKKTGQEKIKTKDSDKRR
ncbi:MAG: hypothetical protein EGR08_07345 [Prevotella sp.]|nr:hypothetical protein [Prevotella sp.]